MASSSRRKLGNTVSEIPAMHREPGNDFSRARTSGIGIPERSAMNAGILENGRPRVRL